MQEKSESGEGGERSQDDCDRAELVYGTGVRTLWRMEGARSIAARPLTRVHVVRQLVPCTSAVHESATVSKSARRWLQVET